MLPCIIFEDEHLLVVNKPAGMNTHSPAPFAGEGLYEWVRDREPRWSNLAIIHRLDKETSGVMVFSKTKEANRELTKQFEMRRVSKQYLFLSAGKVAEKEFTAKTCLVRAGERYVVRPLHPGGVVAETRFRLWETASTWAGPGRMGSPADLRFWEAEPKTGRTHQIRAQAAASGIPIYGDTLYGGETAGRVFLHAAQIQFVHPRTGERVSFKAEPEFDKHSRMRLREALIDCRETNCYRIINGAADGMASWCVDRLGDYLLSQSEGELSAGQRSELDRLAAAYGSRAAYHKILSRSAKGRSGAEAQPKLVFGEAAPERFTVEENGLAFELSFGEGYSVGIFLDQRDNRRRLLTGHAGADFSSLGSRVGVEVLNTFAYTCAFSVCAAKSGARVTSLDLSKKYLDWGKRNFELNGVDPAKHDFIYGDVFNWLPRLAKKGRRFDLALLDPPTFSQSKESGVFRAEKDYGKLIKLILPLVKEGGMLFCSCNTAGWDAAEFMTAAQAAVRAGGRKVVQERYCPQPPDFPISREEPAYLKTVWLRLDGANPNRDGSRDASGTSFGTAENA